MTVSSWLQETTHQLQQADIPSARLDCLILLEDLLKINRARILARPEMALLSAQVATLNKKITQRKQHVPLAYIRGKVAFYGRDFVVNDNVLVPRPESEAMIEILKNIELLEEPCIADIGTGSGCLGLTAACEFPNAKVWLYDISTDALQVAKTNASKLQVKNTFFKQQDLLQDDPQPFDAVLANLPYVPQNFAINKDAAHEPAIALFAGKDGLDAYRLLWQQLGRHPRPPRHVITESLPKQHPQLVQLAAQHGYSHHLTQGLVQYFVRTS